MNKRRAYVPLNVDEPSESTFFGTNLNEDAAATWKSVALSIFLLLLGILFFTFSILHATGHFINSHGAGYGFFVLGLLTFTPGFYHSRIAYYAWRGYNGYSFKSIPTF